MAIIRFIYFIFTIQIIEISSWELPSSQTSKQTDLMNLQAQIREQMSSPDLHVFTLKFLVPQKNWFFPHKKYFPKLFDFCLPLFNATFQCGP